MSGPFDQVHPDDLARLIDGYPLAWVMPLADPALATPMPVLLESDTDGTLRSLLGHLPLAHPAVAALRADSSALFLFHGPHAYISPAWLTDKDWAPTWNFAVAKLTADVALDEGLTDEALRCTVAHMERDQADPWTVAQMGARYESLKRRVIGFRATITGVSARFKLGQDEKPAVFGEILTGLGDHPIAAWMKDAVDRA
ncbi:MULTISPECIES: FMN-binding negative transcriptional regulator [Sphingobium]|uniref:FMN-binding negative transcriptional regulator n=1 Tax=Sphingobium TaxID=165695 RepID=UPI00159CC1DE|nr:FMN-binding negative transcriptional regulator [Sphingobium sp. 15-1]